MNELLGYRGWVHFLGWGGEVGGLIVEVGVGVRMKKILNILNL